jgi:hypothetical protein
MHRRTLIAAALSAASGGLGQTPPARPAVFELRRVRMRNGEQVSRTTEFYEKSYLPAARRAGADPAGFFNGLIAEHSPALTVLTRFDSLAAMETVLAKLDADREYQKALAAYGMGAAPFDSSETTLLRGFRTMPGIELPPPQPDKPPRVFELRSYEANSPAASRRKIAMFDDDEIRIFRKCDMRPVFFGEAIAGPNLPNLTYMLAFDDLAHRERAWRTFLADPDWQKLRVQPGLSDAEIVSKISSAILRPLAFSSIR